MQIEIIDRWDVIIWEEHSDDISKLLVALPYYGSPDINEESKD